MLSMVYSMGLYNNHPILESLGPELRKMMNTYALKTILFCMFIHIFYYL
jgi:hypothetical protein